MKNYTTNFSELALDSDASAEGYSAWGELFSSLASSLYEGRKYIYQNIKPAKTSLSQASNLLYEGRKYIYQNIKPAKPSLSQASNIVTATLKMGPEVGAAVAASSVVDATLKNSFPIYKKNYATLSLFWLTIAYNASGKIDKSDFIPVNYKLPAKIAYGAASAALIYYGADFLDARSVDDKRLQESIESFVLISRFFELKEGEIRKIEDAFGKSYSDGARAIYEHRSSLYNNEYINGCIKTQALNLAELIIKQQILTRFSSIEYLSLDSVAGEKDSVGFINLIFSKLLYTGFSISTTKGFEYARGHSGKNIEQLMSKKIASKLFAGGKNSEKIMKLGDDIGNFSYSLQSAKRQSDNAFGDLFNIVLSPFLNPVPKKDVLEVLTNLPLLVINRALFKGQIVYSVVSKLTELFSRNEVGDDILKKFMQPSVQSMGGMTLRTNMDPESYAFQNLQEIIKLGGEKYILEYLNEFYEVKSQVGERVYGQNDAYIRSMADLFQEIASALGVMTQAIPFKEYNKVYAKISLVMNMLGMGVFDINWNQPCDLNKLKEMLSFLENSLTNVPSRLKGDELELLVKNYKLKIKEDTEKQVVEKVLFEIESLIFEAGKFYAIYGKNGAGKTTFLTDIAKCLNRVFESSGDIYYPAREGQLAKIVFCGSKPFSPPKKSLFDKVTYRLDSDYVAEHKNVLKKQALELFKVFGQEKRLNNDSLDFVGDTTKLGLSDGQMKLVIIAAAMLYKIHMKEPVLLVLDETLSMLDEETAKKVCNKIKELFADSIVIAVDHDYKSKMTEYKGFDFYTNPVNLFSYSPGYKDKSDEEEEEVESFVGHPPSSIDGESLADIAVTGDNVAED